MSVPTLLKTLSSLLVVAFYFRFKVLVNENIANVKRNLFEMQNKFVRCWVSEA